MVWSMARKARRSESQLQSDSRGREFWRNMWISSSAWSGKVGADAGECFHGGGDSRSRGLPAVRGAAGSVRRFSFRETLYGTGEEFEYVQCPSCRSLWATRREPDLARYYPAGYYARFAPGRSGLKRRMKRMRAAGARGEGSVAGVLLAHVFGSPPFMRWMTPFAAGPQSRILDVGCGAGELLLHMSDAGFTRLTGVDPFIDGDIEYAEGVRVLRRPLAEVSGAFDVIMMHHVLEHAEDPAAMVREAAALLGPGGGLLLRTPLAGGYAWRTYGSNWIQLDPPRHRCILTRDAVELVLERFGLRILRWEYDSTAFQFWGSEMARRGLPVARQRPTDAQPWKGVFTPGEVRKMERRAAELNREADGDQVCVWAVRS